MRDHTRHRAFELAIEPKIVGTEKVLNGLIRALQVVVYPSAFSLQPKHLSSSRRRAREAKRNPPQAERWAFGEAVAG
jgi:hypothetical protein